MKRSAQTATEMMVILAVILVLAFFAVELFIDTPQVVNQIQKQDAQKYFQSLPVAVEHIQSNQTHIEIALTNALKEDVFVSSIALNNVKLYVNDTLSKGTFKEIRRALPAALKSQKSFRVAINYTLVQSNTNVSFDSSPVVYYE